MMQAGINKFITWSFRREKELLEFLRNCLHRPCFTALSQQCWADTGRVSQPNEGLGLCPERSGVGLESVENS